MDFSKNNEYTSLGTGPSTFNVSISVHIELVAAGAEPSGNPN